jgi:hypothetical protein
MDFGTNPRSVYRCESLDDRNVAFAGGILHSMRIPLTAKKPEEDSAKVEVLRRRGWKTDDGIELTHYFTLRANPGSEPHTAAEELSGWGLSASTDEEASGDGHWHVTARGYWELPAEGEAPPWRKAMDGVAARHGLIYDGWDVSPGSPSAMYGTRPRMLKRLLPLIGIVAVAMFLLTIFAKR